MKIMKFGGGCLKDGAALARVADIIARERPRPAVVVSAVHGVTDALAGAVAAALEEGGGPAARLGRIRRQHAALAEGAMKDPALLRETTRSFEEILDRTERLLLGVAYSGEASPAVRGRILSCGERLACRLLAGALRARGVPAKALDSDRMGMITDENLENATVDLARFRKRLTRTAGEVRRGRFVPVITGFFGVTPAGHVSLFGRNGSDYSAAVVAHALRAGILEIWKDVEGFLSADPTAVPEARRVGRLSFTEAAELSYFGAKILHPRTLEPAAGMDLEVRIKNMSDPEGPGTEVVRRAPRRKGAVKSVTSSDEVALLRIHGPGVGLKPGIIGRIGSRLAALDINIRSVITSQTCINLLVDRKDALRGHRALRDDRNGVVERVDLEEEVALVAAVGEGLADSLGIAARVFSAVARAGVNVEMISSGASKAAAYFIVARGDSVRAVRALHAEFFSGWQDLGRASPREARARRRRPLDGRGGS